MAYTRRGFKGGAAPTTLTADASSGSTSMVCDDLTTWAGVATTGPFGFTINRANTDEEQCQATGISGTNLIGVTRGVGGTAAQAHVAGATIEHTTITADFDEANAHIADPTLDHHTQYQRIDGTRVLTGLEHISIPADGTSLLISRGIPAISVGSVVIGRDSIAKPQSLVFFGGIATNWVIGRQASDDTLRFATHDGTFTVTRMSFDAAGGIFGHGPNHYFGVFADSVTTGARIHIGGLAGGGGSAILWAEGSGADTALNLRSKGAGYVEMQNSVGTNLLALGPGGEVIVGTATTGTLWLQNANNVSATASAGPNALPATPGGFVTIYLLGGPVKIPYYPV